MNSAGKRQDPLDGESLKIFVRVRRCKFLGLLVGDFACRSRDARARRPARHPALTPHHARPHATQPPTRTATPLCPSDSSEKRQSTSCCSDRAQELFHNLSLPSLSLSS